MDYDANATLPPAASPPAGPSSELLSRLDIEEYLDQLGRAEPISSQVRLRLTGLLCNLDRSGRFESVSPPPPGRTYHGYMKDDMDDAAGLTPQERQVVSGFRQRCSGVATGSGEFALGNILVVDGQISRSQLESALLRQAGSGRRLGEELIAAGHASKSQVEGGLSLQRTLITYAMAITVGLGPLVMVGSLAEAAQNTAALSVSAKVIANTRMQMLHQATQLTISAADIARGHVELPAATRFSVRTNSPVGYRIEFHSRGDLFDAVAISGLGRPAHLGADGGSIAQRGLVATELNHELSFRFTLRPGLLPGTYPWPLAMAVRTL